MIEKLIDFALRQSLLVAAATVASDGKPSTLPFVTVDERLARAADREGFPVVTPGRA